MLPLNIILWVAGAAIVLVGATFLAVGLYPARTLLRREFTAYFLSPIAYVVLFVFYLVWAVFFNQTLSQLTAMGPKGIEYPMQSMIGDRWFWLIFLFIPPVLTMRLFAEERSSGTLESLMTAPLRDWQVVLCKYLACFAFYVIMWLPTLIYLPVLLDLRPPQWNGDAWTVFSITMVIGLGAIGTSFIATILALGGSWRFLLKFGIGLFVIGAATTAIGAYGHYHGEFVARLDVLLLLGGVVCALLSLAVTLRPKRRHTTALALGFMLAGFAFLVGAAGIRFGTEAASLVGLDVLPIHELPPMGDAPEAGRLLLVPYGVDPMPVLSAYLGLALVGAMFLSVGLLVSSLVRSQLIAFMISFVICLALFVIKGVFTPHADMSNVDERVLFFFTVPQHFARDFTRGLVDTRHLVLYASVTIFCLFLTVRSLESRRWL